MDIVKNNLVEQNISSDTPLRSVSSEKINKEEKDLTSTSSEQTNEQQLTTKRRKPSSLGQGGFGSIDDHSGSYSYRVPVHIPPAQHGGPTPKISLNYSSQQGNAPSLIANGWRLELGRIERSSEKSVNFKNNQGTKDARDFFELSFNGSKRSLVITRNNNSEQLDNSFRIKIESSFLVVNYILSTTVKDPDSGEFIIDYWDVYSADGTRYRYGHIGDNPSKNAGGELLNKIWNLTEIKDVYGRKVIYEYKAIVKGAGNELPYSYPTKVKSGVSKDRLWWDCEIRFRYTNKDLPSSSNGYVKLGANYTGRPASRCIIWERITHIETWFRDKDNNFAKSRVLKLENKQVNKKVRWLEKIEEIGYRNGTIDKNARLPAHTFTYKRTRLNPALALTTTTPMGKVEKLSYDLATRLDKGEAKGFVNDFYLIKSYTEQAGSTANAESWTKLYEYHDGRFYLPFEEYRGHQKVVVTDKETRMKTVSEFEQNGVHNGYTAKVCQYDASAKSRLMSRTETSWMALDYGGGRFLPFEQKRVETRFAENGSTVLSTVIREIVKDDKEVWQYALDKYGNVLKQQERTYAGSAKTGPLVRTELTETTYRPNKPGATHRFIGLPETIKTSVKGSKDKKFILSALEERQYNQHGQIIESKKHLDRSNHFLRTRYEYDPEHGQEIKQIDYDGGREIIASTLQYYNENHAQRHLAKSERNALGHETHYSHYDLQSREPERIETAQGIIEETEFDGLNRIVAEHRTTQIGRKLTETISHQYSITKSQRSVLTTHENSGHTSKEFYDQLGRVLLRKESGYQAQTVIHDKTSYEHKTRKPAIIQEPHFKGETSFGSLTIRYDDPQLRKSSEKSASGRLIEYRHKGLTLRSQEYVFAEVEDSKDKENAIQVRTLEEERNVFGLVVKRSEGTAGQSNYYQIQLRYDALDRPISTIDNLGVPLRKLDYSDRLDDQPQSSDDISLRHLKYEYDRLGRVIKTQHGKDQHISRVISATYDDLDRILKRTERDPSSNTVRETQNTYDTQVQATGELGEQTLTEKSDDGSVKHNRKFTFDAFGLPESETNRWLINWPDLGVKRDLTLLTETNHNGLMRDRLERVVHRSVQGLEKSVIDYRYDDPSGLPTVILANKKPIWKIGDAGFTAREQARAITLGNKLASTTHYDPNTGLVNDIETKHKKVSLLHHTISYDTSDNISSRTDSSAALKQQQPTQTASSQVYSYDEKHQLRSTKGGKDTETFTYKANGSLETKSAAEGKANYRYKKSSPHSASDVSGKQKRSLNYDAEGRLSLDINKANGMQRRFTWLPSNRLYQLEFTDAEQKSMRTLRYAYDGANQRTLMYDSLDQRLVVHAGLERQLSYTTNGELRINTHIQIPNAHRSSELESEMPGNTRGASRQKTNKDEQEREQQDQQSQQHNTEPTSTLPLRRIATLEQSSTSKSTNYYYYHRDHQFSVIAVSDGVGKLVATMEYDAFGKIRHQSGDYQPDILFTGQRADIVEYAGFRLYDFKSRCYDPDLGVFLSPDVVDDANNSAFGLNRYVYVGNNPTSRIDPTGHWIFLPALITAAWGAGSSVVSGYVMTKALGGDYSWTQLATDAILGGVSGGSLGHAGKILKLSNRHKKLSSKLEKIKGVASKSVPKSSVDDTFRASQRAVNRGSEVASTTQDVVKHVNKELQKRVPKPTKMDIAITVAKGATAGSTRATANKVAGGEAYEKK